MQRSGTEAIRTKLQPSKPNREITNITNSQNTKRTYGQPSEQLFSKRWPLSNRNRTKHNMNTCKVKRHQNSDTKNRQQRTRTKRPHSQNDQRERTLKVYKPELWFSRMTRLSVLYKCLKFSSEKILRFSTYRADTKLHLLMLQGE